MLVNRTTTSVVMGCRGYPYRFLIALIVLIVLLIAEIVLYGGVGEGGFYYRNALSLQRLHIASEGNRNCSEETGYNTSLASTLPLNRSLPDTRNPR